MLEQPIRASDKERDSVVDVLRDAYTDGRLTLDEFDERVSAAYAAKTWTDLRELTADLPVEPVLGADLHYRAQPAPPQPGRLTAGPRQARRDHPLNRLLPVVFVWILISATAGSAEMATVLSFVFVCLLACRMGRGRRG
jgi:Domain of unknown function (DUF1707)